MTTTTQHYRPGRIDPRERFSTRAHLLIEPDVHGWPEAYFLMTFDELGMDQNVATYRHYADAVADFDHYVHAVNSQPI